MTRSSRRDPRRGLQPTSLVDLKVGDITVKGSNLGKDARYDQILHMPTLKKRFTNYGGTLDFPIWVQIDTDIDGQRLTQIVQNAKK